jgi:hypothetical protein
MGYQEDLDKLIERENASAGSFEGMSEDVPDVIDDFDAALKTEPKPVAKVSPISGKPMLPGNPAAKARTRFTNEELAKSDAYSNPATYEDGTPIFLGGMTPGVWAPLSGPGISGIKIDRTKYNYMKWAKEPDPSKRGLIRNVPNSLYKLPGRIVGYLFHDYPQQLIDEFDRQVKIRESEQYMKGTSKERTDSEKDYQNRQIQNALQPLWGMIDMALKNSGLWDVARDTKNKKTVYIKQTPEGPKVEFDLPDFKEFSEAWKSDPVGNAFLYLPLVKYALAKSKAKAAATEAERIKFEAAAAEELARAQEARKGDTNITTIERDTFSFTAKVAEDEFGWTSQDSWYEGPGSKQGPSVGPILDETHGPLKKAFAKAKEKEKAKKAPKKKKTPDQKMNEAEEAYYGELRKELDEAKTQEERDAVFKKFEEYEAKKEAKSSDQNLNKEVNKDTVAELSSDLDVFYEGVAETGEHKLTIKPKGVSSAEAKAGGLETTVLVVDFTDAMKKIQDKVNEFNKIDDIKNNSVDKITGLKKERPSRSKKKPEEEDFFQDADTTYQKTQVLREFEADIMEDPYLYLASLVNEVNRWYHKMDGANIEGARRKLSEFASRIDELREDFLNLDVDAMDSLSKDLGLDAKKAMKEYDYNAAFEDFKATVQNASQWSKRLKQKNEMSETAERTLEPLKKEERHAEDLTPEAEYGTVADIEFLMGVPVDRVWSMLKDRYRILKGSMIKSVNDSEVQIIKDIAALHTKGKFDVDITYSKGEIWKKVGMDPKHKFDKYPQTKDTIQADASTRIPMQNNSVESVFFDPPFLVRAGKVGGKDTGMMTGRFTGFESVDALWEMISGSIHEAARILKPGGVLVIKLQDVSHGGSKYNTKGFYMSTAEAYNYAVQAGLRPLDRFIYENKNPMPLPPSVKQQNIAKKVHNDFLVFKKPGATSTYKHPKASGVKLFSGVPINKVWDPIRKLWVITKKADSDRLDLKPGDTVRVKETRVLDGMDVGGIPEKILDWLDNVPNREPTKVEWSGLIDKIRSALPTKEAVTTFNRYCAELGVTKDYYNILSVVNALNKKGLFTDEMMSKALDVSDIFKSSGVTKLYSGVDPVEAFEKISGYFKSVTAAKQSNLERAESSRFTRMFREAKRRFLSQSANIKEDLMFVHKDTGGYEALRSMNLAVSATSKGAALADQFKTEILSGLNPLQREALNEVVFAKRTRQVIDNDTLAGTAAKDVRKELKAKYKAGEITKEEYKEALKQKDAKSRKHKNPLGLGREYWQSYIDNIGMKGLTPDEVQEVYRRADMLFDIYRDQLRQLRDEGLITEDVFQDLQHMDYQRRQMIDIIDPEVHLGGTRISVRESGVKELRIGSETQLLETDSIRLMEDLVVRTQARIMANRAAKDLYNIAKNNPESPIVRLKEPVEWAIGEEKMVMKPESTKGWSKIHVFIDGEKKTMYMPDSYAKEWVTKNREMSVEFGKFARIVSGSSILRAMATGVNVGFAIKNIFRDFAYMWVASQHYVKGAGWQSTYSTFAPKAMMQMASDFRAVAKDVALRKGIYKDMVEDGVLLDFLSGKDKIMKERIGKDPNPHLQAVIDALYYASTTSELLGRASLYNRARRKGLSRQEAAYLARDYMFFGDYGTFTKAVDTVVPYFGATIKATEGIWRSLKRNPKEFSLKAVQAMLFGATMYLLNDAINPEAYKQLSDRDKQNNIIVPFYIPFTGTDGKDKHMVPKIPKDSGQAFFMALGENAMKFMMGREMDSNAIVAGLKGLVPVQEIPTVPAAEAIFSYVLNKDFWSHDDIWKGPEVDPEAEVITAGPNRTHPLAVGAGKVTGLSPERLSKSIQSVTTRGNYLTDAFLGITNQLFGKPPKDVRDMNVAEILSTNSTFRGMLATTDDLNPIREELGDIERKSNTEKVMHNGEISRLIEQVKEGTRTEEDIYNYLDSIQDENEVARLENRIEMERTLLDLPHRNFWRRLDSMSPEDAARAYHLFTRDMTPAQNEKILDEFDQVCAVKEIATDRFLDELSRLEEEYEMKKEEGR